MQSMSYLSFHGNKKRKIHILVFRESDNWVFMEGVLRFRFFQRKSFWVYGFKPCFHKKRTSSSLFFIFFVNVQEMAQSFFPPHWGEILLRQNHLGPSRVERCARSDWKKMKTWIRRGGKGKGQGGKGQGIGAGAGSGLRLRGRGRGRGSQP